MQLFDYLNAVTSGKDELTEDDLKGYSPFMMNRYISMCEAYLPIVAQVNQYALENLEHYRFFKSVLPKRRQFFPYIKKNKTKNLERINAIKEYFEVGQKDAEAYYDILGEDNLKRLMEKMGGVVSKKRSK